MIVSLATIARQAAAAAQQWEPGQPKPANPYCRNTAPEHHKAWRRAFKRALLELSAEVA